MAIKLVPDEVEADAELTEDQVREYLAKLSTPKLVAFRAHVLSMKTSELIGCMSNPDQVAGVISTGAIFSDEDKEAAMAAMLAIADEIDRRMPIPS